MRGMCRFIEGRVPEECVQRRKTVVARPGAVAPVEFEVLEEIAQEGGIEILQTEVGRRPSKVLCGETQQQAEGVPIAGHRMRTRAELSEQSIREETLEVGKKSLGCS